MVDKDFDEMSEDELIAFEKADNKRLRRKNRKLREAIMDKITKDKDSEEFANLDGSNKQVYALVAVMDGMDRDIQESEKALASKESAGDTGALVTALMETIIERVGDPSKLYSNGTAGTRTIGDGKRLRPDNTASSQHMHKGADDIQFDQVFGDDSKKDDNDPKPE